MKKLFAAIPLLALALFGCTPSSSSISPSSSAPESSIPTESNSSEKPVYENVSYQNPLRFHKQDGSEYFVTCADPDVIYGDDGYWYMYCTNTSCEMGDKGVAYDRGPIFRSQNLIDWTWVGSVFDGHSDALEWGDPDAGVWAPSVLKVGDTYNYYYSLSLWGDSNPGIGVATSPTPYGPWTHYGMVLDSETSGVSNSIDPQALYVGEELYLVWGSFYGIAATKLTDDGIEPFCGLSALKDNLIWIVEDNSGGTMDIDINYEGSYIIEIDGSWYYFGSQGSCCSGVDSTYRVKVGKSDSFFGDFKGSDGKKLHEGTYGDLVIGPSEQVAGTGHNTIVRDFAGDYWIFYHGFDINGEFPNERVPFIDKLLFDEDTGMPYVSGYKASYREEKVGPCVIASYQ